MLVRMFVLAKIFFMIFIEASLTAGRAEIVRLAFVFRCISSKKRRFNADSTLLSAAHGVGQILQDGFEFELETSIFTAYIGGPRYEIYFFVSSVRP